MASTAQKQTKKPVHRARTHRPRPQPIKATVWESRAVLRLIEPGSVAECPHCAVSG